jgi:hypothetical protein
VTCPFVVFVLLYFATTKVGAGNPGTERKKMADDGAGNRMATLCCCCMCDCLTDCCEVNSLLPEPVPDKRWLI